MTSVSLTGQSDPFLRQIAEAVQARHARAQSFATPEAMDALRARLAALPCRPWLYRPVEHDDWGCVRSADGWPIVRPTIPRWSLTDDDLGEHRRAKTDPVEAIARFLAEAPEIVEGLVAEIERLRARVNDLETSANILPVC